MALVLAAGTGREKPENQARLTEESPDPYNPASPGMPGNGSGL